VNVSTVVGDATREDDVATGMDTVVERHGRLDVIVVDAGTPALAAPITEFDVEDFDRTLAVHVRGPSSPASTACGCSPTAAAS
jgi:NAD(P)-dependent dehydrogenase (short-subunit alcohol dehydrogenase family)